MSYEFFREVVPAVVFFEPVVRSVAFVEVVAAIQTVDFEVNLTERRPALTAMLAVFHEPAGDNLRLALSESSDELPLGVDGLGLRRVSAVNSCKLHGFCLLVK